MAVGVGVGVGLTVILVGPDGVAEGVGLGLGVDSCAGVGETLGVGVGEELCAKAFPEIMLIMTTSRRQNAPAIANASGGLFLERRILDWMPRLKALLPPRFALLWMAMGQ